MGSISSTNPGLTDLLQTLSTADPSLLSSPSVTSALENASPTDIVELSDAAMQLQSVDAMFGNPAASSADPMTQAMASLFGVQDTFVHGRSHHASFGRDARRAVQFLDESNRLGFAGGGDSSLARVDGQPGWIFAGRDRLVRPQ